MEDNKKIVLEEIAGKGYSSEIKLLREVLKNLPYKNMEALCAIGDRGFDSIEIMEYLYKKKLIINFV